MTLTRYIGISYSELEQYIEAIKEGKQAIQIEPDEAIAHLNLGITYGLLTSYSEAIEECKQAIYLKPNYRNAHYELGLFYLYTGNRSGALDEYKILKDLDKDLAQKLFDAIYP